jgi:hypothetical protein
MPLLEPFAERHGARSNANWIESGLADEGPFVHRFFQALYRTTSRGGRILFNLDDLSLTRALATQRFSDPFAEDVGVTNWELQQLLHNRAFYDKTDFFIGDQKLTQEEMHDLGLDFRGSR